MEPSITFRSPDIGDHTPDLIAASRHGVVRATGTKLEEHGGFSSDDRNVALMVAAGRLYGTVIEAPVTAARIAPTILTALGLDPNPPEGVADEGTQALPR